MDTLFTALQNGRDSVSNDTTNKVIDVLSTSKHISKYLYQKGTETFPINFCKEMVNGKFSTRLYIEL